MHLPHFVKTSCGTPLPVRLVWRVAQPPEASPRRRVVRAKGMYNSLPKSIQSLGLLVISAGPFHCALARCVPNPAPLARLCRVRFHRRQSKKQNRHKVGLFFWCGRRESNPRLQLGKLTCCHYTTPAIVWCILYPAYIKVQHKKHLTFSGCFLYFSGLGFILP